MAITSALLTKILYEFMALSALLLLGTLLRAKVKAFQNLFLPASVIGGFIGLLLGPVVLGNSAIIPFPTDWIKDFAVYPGILIIPIIAAAPLGIVLPNKKEFAGSVGPHFIIATAIIFFQFAAGSLIGGFFIATDPKIYPTLGLELFGGFWGGHATAGLLGGTLKDLGLPYWQLSQGVCVTTATVGLISGIVIGTALINWAARKKYTAVLTKPSDIPEPIKKGYFVDVQKQPSVGRTTILSESIDVLAFHLALILSVTGLAYILLFFLKKNHIPILQDLSVWLWALLLMFGVWALICKLKLDWTIDRKIVNRVSSLLMEYAVTAAIVSIPVRTVLEYIVPIIFLSIVAIIITTVICVYPLGVRFLPNPWLERGIATFGQSTGVFMTGMLLLRIADPDFRTEALTSYSLSFALSSLFAWPFFALAPKIILSWGSFSFAGLSLAIALFTLVIAYIIGWTYPSPSKR